MSDFQTDNHDLTDETEGLFESIANIAPAMLWITDADHHCVFLSHGWCEFTGQQESEGLKTGWVDAVHPDDRDRAMKIFMEAAQRHEPFSLDYRLRHVDGGYRWAIDTARPRFGQAGEFLGYVGSVIDIHDRKTAEESIRNAFGLLDGIAQGSEGLIAAEDGEFRYTYFNDAYRREFKKLWGHDLEIGMSMVELLAKWPEEQRKAIGLWSRALRGESFSVTERFGPSKGEEQVYALRFIPVLDDKGVTAGAAHILSNVTEQVKTQEALRESEEHFRGTFENAAVGITHVDPRQRFIRVNQKFCEIVGYSVEELVGLSSYDITYEDDRAHTPEFDALFRGELPNMNMEKRYIRKDGRIVWVRLTSSIRRDSEGAPQYRINVAEDISRRKRAGMRMAAEHDVSRALASARTLEEAAPRILKSLCEALDLAASELWLPEADGKAIRCAFVYTSEKFEGADRWRETATGMRLSSGEGAVGETWQSKAPSWTLGEEVHKPWPRRDLAKELGITGSKQLPLLVGDACLGVISMQVTRQLVVSDVIEDSLSLLSHEIGQFVLRAQAEKALTESEQRFRDTFENAGVGIAMITPGVRSLIRVNRRFCDIVGYSREELIGRDIFDITAEEDRNIDPGSHALLRREVDHAVREKRYIHKDGRLVWARVTSTVQYDHYGDILNWISVVEDISDRKRFEMRLAAEHAVSQSLTSARTLDEAAPKFLKALCETLQVNVGELWLSDDDGGSIYCSHLHMSDDFQRREAWKDTAFTTRYKPGERVPGTAWQRKSPMWRMDISESSDSERKNLGISAGLVSNMAFPVVAGGECIGIVFLHARRRLVEDELLEASLSSLGRDIGQFMQREHAEASLLKSNAALEQRVVQRTEELESLTNRLRRLVHELTMTEQTERRRLAELIHDDLQQLLVAARMQVISLRSGSRKVNIEKSSEMALSFLDQAIEEARTLTSQLRPPALYESGLTPALRWLAEWMEEAHGLKVKTDLDPQAEPDREHDAVFLFESVRELLLNTVKYADVSEARISMVKEDDARLRLTVRDNGKGFDPAALEAGSVQGKGFGLFSIRERMQALGGECVIESAPGAGTTVHLLAPVGVTAVTVASETYAGGPGESSWRITDTARRASSGLIRVVIADDHSIVRQGIAGIIEATSDMIVVEEVADGQAAVEAARKFRPDIMVMDVNMPRMNGIEATRAISEDASDIQIVGLSIHGDQATRQAMLDAGANAYHLKDGPAESLIASIRQLVGRPIGDPEESVD